MVLPLSADPVRVGLLHSLTGTMALSEAPLVDAALMAIAEINQGGGVLGRPVEPVVRDGASHPDRFVAMAEQLIDGDRVATVFGCWTSLSRKAVLPVFESRRVLLWYPVQYEGLEQSPWVFYTGSCPNQQVEPALDWLMDQGKRRIYLVGSDYVFPRVAHKLIRGRLKGSQGEVVGEDYIPLGGDQFGATIEAIQRIQPSAIFNTLNGDSNLAFYQAYHRAGITPDQIPIMAVSVSEPELQRLGAAAVGHYASWSYFQSLDTPANRQFVDRFKQRYGPDRVTSDPIEAAYCQVHLWQQAVEAAQSLESDRVRQAAYGLEWNAPGGSLCCAPNHHLHKHCYIGQAQVNGQFAIVNEAPESFAPLPWLGVETQAFASAGVVIDMLGEVSRGVQYSWELEQQSRQLEQALAQLRQEVAQRQQAEAALQAANAEITSLNQALQADNLRMGAELTVARQLQEMILPKAEELLAIDDLDIAGLMAAAEEVGGDYYDVLQASDRSVTIGIGDVTGHGLESGVMMIMAQTAVRTLQVLREDDPVKAFQAINAVLYHNRLRMGSYRNLSLALLIYRQGRLLISGQHEEVIVLRASGEVERIDTIDLGYPVGLIENISTLVAQTQIDLAIGDGIMLYTDGITEAENSQRQLYGLNRLIQHAQSHWGKSASAIRSVIIADVRSHIGNHTVYDDITLVIVKRTV